METYFIFSDFGIHLGKIEKCLIEDIEDTEQVILET